MNLYTGGPYGGNIASSGEQRWRESWAISCGRSREQSGSVQAPRSPRPDKRVPRPLRTVECEKKGDRSKDLRDERQPRVSVWLTSERCLRADLPACACPLPFWNNRLEPLRRLLRTSIRRGTVHLAFPRNKNGGEGGATGQHPARPNHCRRMNPEPAQRPPIYKRHRGAQAAHRKGEFWSLAGPCKTRVACPHQKVKELHTNSAPLTPAPRLLAFPVVWARGGHGSTATRLLHILRSPAAGSGTSTPAEGASEASAFGRPSKYVVSAAQELNLIAVVLGYALKLFLGIVTSVDWRAIASILSDAGFPKRGVWRDARLGGFCLRGVRGRR